MADFSTQEATLRMVQVLLADLDKFIDEMPERFDKRLFRRIRTRSGSQLDWAEKAHVSQGTIGNWERGVTSPIGGYRRALVRAAQYFRDDLQEYWSSHLSKGPTLFDPIATDDQLKTSILRAALTDFHFDQASQKILARAFPEDNRENSIDQIQEDKANLLASLESQANALLEELSSAGNVPTEKVSRYLERYRDELRSGSINPRLLNRHGQTISRAINEEDFSSAITQVDNEAFAGFSSDHLELMRLYFREALARSQEIDANELADEAEIDDGTQFGEIANLMESAEISDGVSLMSKDIPTILRDIATEMKEMTEVISFTTSADRRRALMRRKAQAFKTGSVYVGRFVFFAALVTAVAGTQAGAVAGAVATIVEVSAPGTIRGQYERLRESFPVLPSLPELKRKSKHQAAAQK